MVGTLVHQLAGGQSARDFDRSGVGAYYIDHAEGVFPASAGGVPYTAGIAVKADPIADLVENLAAEQKARATYDNILKMSDDPDVDAVIKFLRAREVVHFQRFGEVLTQMQDKMKDNSSRMVPAATGGWIPRR